MTMTTSYGSPFHVKPGIPYTRHPDYRMTYLVCQASQRLAILLLVHMEGQLESVLHCLQKCESPVSENWPDGCYLHIAIWKQHVIFHQQERSLVRPLQSVLDANL